MIPYTVSFVFTVAKVKTVAIITAVSSVLSVLALADMYTTGYMLNTITIIILLLFTNLWVFFLSRKIVLFGAVLLVCSNTYHIAGPTIYGATFLSHSTSSSSVAFRYTLSTSILCIGQSFLAAIAHIVLREAR